MKRHISGIIAIATFIFILFVLVSKFDVIKENFLRHKIYFLLISLAYIGGRMLDGIKLNVLVSRFGLKIKKSECFGLSLMLPLYNLMFPNAGQVANALYLKSKYKFKYRHFVSVGLIRIITTIMVSGFIGISASLAYMVRHRNLLLTVPVAVYLALMCLALAVFFIPVPGFLRRYSFFDKLDEAIKGVKDIRSDKKLILSLVSLQVGIILLFLSRYYIVFKALSLDAPLVNIAAVIPLTALSNLINLMPGNLALREAIVSTSALLLGYSLGDGVLVASIDRAVLLTTLLIVGGWFFIRLRYFENLIVFTGSREITTECNDA